MSVSTNLLERVWCWQICKHTGQNVQELAFCSKAQNLLNGTSPGGLKLSADLACMFLGMQSDKHINLHNAAEEALTPCLAGMACMRTFAHQHQITHRLHAYL
eukprot:52864-Pelagomonas_calceolata.AAC.1